MDLQALLLCAVVFVVVVGFQAVIGGKSFGSQGSRNTHGDLQIRRKMQHAISGILMVVAYRGGMVTRFGSFATLMAAAAFGFALHQRRLRSPDFNATLMKHFGNVLRPHERVDTLPAAEYLILGAAVAVVVGSMHVTNVSILMIAVGDPCASLAGSIAGKGLRVLRGKSLVGSLAMCVACVLTAYLYLLYWGPPMPESVRLRWSVASALVATVCEAWPLPLDDNLVVPAGTSLAMLGLSTALPENFPPL